MIVKVEGSRLDAYFEEVKPFWGINPVLLDIAAENDAGQV